MNTSRFRPLRAAILLVALAGCSDSTGTDAPAALRGSWTLEYANSEPLQTTAGLKSTRGRVVWTFEPNGEFSQRTSFVAGNESTDISLRTGTYVAGNGTLVMTTRATGENFNPIRWPLTLTATPIPQPSAETVGYRVVGSKLKLTLNCPPTALCASGFVMNRSR